MTIVGENGHLMTNNENAEGVSASRRAALKIGVAAAAGAAVWTEPTLKGLARRPAYAAGSSAAPIDFTFNTNINRGETVSVTVGGVTVSITRGSGGQPETGEYEFSSSDPTVTLSNTSLTIDGNTPVFPDPPTLPFTLSGLSGNGQNRPVIGTITCT